MSFDEIGNTNEGTGSTCLFLGDVGELSIGTRRVLVQLLVGPSIDAKRHPNLWSVLIENESVVRSRLCDLFLDLVIDRDLQVAFTRQPDTGDLEVPKLLRRARLTFIDSALLIFLRQQLPRFESQGERAVVSIDEIQEYLALFEKSANTDHAGFSKRVQASIEKINKFNMLRKIRGSDDRYEISPTLKLLFSAEEISGLIEVYRNFSENPQSTQTVEMESDWTSEGEVNE